jgi:hypothetical protein
MARLRDLPGVRRRYPCLLQTLRVEYESGAVEWASFQMHLTADLRDVWQQRRMTTASA